MLNVLNVAFEHALEFTIDDHKMWIIANDGGFVEPQLVDVLYITSGTRYTVLVKLDREGADYAMRFVSTSTHQNLHGISILRYPVRSPLSSQHFSFSTAEPIQGSTLPSSWSSHGCPQPTQWLAPLRET